MKPEALLELPNLPLELLHDPLLFAKDSLELGAPRTAFLLPLRATSHADKIGSGQPVALGEFPKKLSLYPPRPDPFQGQRARGRHP